MLRGGNMRFRPAIFFWFVFAQSFLKFHKNGDIRKLKACSLRLWKNDFCRLYNKRARALQSWITFFFIHPVYGDFREGEKPEYLEKNPWSTGEINCSRNSLTSKRQTRLGLNISHANNAPVLLSLMSPLKKLPLTIFKTAKALHKAGSKYCIMISSSLG